MLDTLKQQFADVAGLSFEQRDALILIKIDNAHGQALLTTHGASLLSFKPKQAGAKDCIWVSKTAVYDGTKPVRGGVPVCWPWFGPKEGLPAHGFVRNRLWQLVEAQTLADGGTVIELKTQSDDQTLAMWPVPFELVLRVEVGHRLTMTLTTTNLSDESVDITEAFHTYFAISQPDAVAVTGLEGSECHDKLTGVESFVQADSLAVVPPIDSVFLNQGQAPLQIQDTGWQRQIEIQHQQTASAVVWNPGAELVKGFADMEDNTWPDMLCVEVGNVLQNAVTIPSQATHSMTMTLGAT